MPELIDTPAVWYGEELLARPDWLWTLGDQEIAELARAAEEASAADPGEIQHESLALPALAPRLAEIQDALETGSGATLVRGFPVERFSAQQAIRIFWGIVQHIGTPVSQSARGERIFLDFEAGVGNSRRVRQRQVAMRRHRLGCLDAQLAGRRLAVVIQCFFAILV